MFRKNGRGPRFLTRVRVHSYIVLHEKRTNNKSRQSLEPVGGSLWLAFRSLDNVSRLVRTFQICVLGCGFARVAVLPFALIITSSTQQTMRHTTVS